MQGRWGCVGPRHFWCLSYVVRDALDGEPGVLGPCFATTIWWLWTSLPTSFGLLFVYSVGEDSDAECSPLLALFICLLSREVLHIRLLSWMCGADYQVVISHKMCYRVHCHAQWLFTTGLVWPPNIYLVTCWDKHKRITNRKGSALSHKLYLSTIDPMSGFLPNQCGNRSY